MKLNIVPASRGAQWVKLGIQTFFRQPLALSGLFFIFLAVMPLLNLVPLVGGVLAFVLMPGMTMGLLAATREASEGKFPMPTILVAAFRAGPLQRRQMMVLGVLYTACTALIVCATALIDGGSFARALLGQPLPAEAHKDGGFQLALLFAGGLSMPLTLLFCHAAALIHWHGVPPVKSLFFGLAAIAGNFRAFLIYSLVWMGIFLGFSTTLAALASALGGVQAVATIAFPAMLLLATMVYTSIYFTFQGSFEFTPGDDT